MTRRNLVHKWALYGLGLLLVWVVDAYILSRYPIFGIRPMLLPLAVVSVSVLEGAHAGAGFGLAVGLLWELAYPGGFGGLVIGMSLAGLGAGALSQYALSQSLPGCLICSTLMLCLLDGLRVVQGLMTGSASISALLGVAVPECLVSLLCAPFVYFIFRAIFGRVGGTKLA